MPGRRVLPGKNDPVRRGSFNTPSSRRESAHSSSVSGVKVRADSRRIVPEHGCVVLNQPQHGRKERRMVFSTPHSLPRCCGWSPTQPRSGIRWQMTVTSGHTTHVGCYELKKRSAPNCCSRICCECGAEVTLARGAGDGDDDFALVLWTLGDFDGSGHVCAG